MAVTIQPSTSSPPPPKAQEAPAKPIERPSDKAAKATPPQTTTAVQEPAPAPKPVVNTSGQTTGTKVNTTA